VHSLLLPANGSLAASAHLYERAGRDRGVGQQSNKVKQPLDGAGCVRKAGWQPNWQPPIHIMDNNTTEVVPVGGESIRLFSLITSHHTSSPRLVNTSANGAPTNILAPHRSQESAWELDLELRSDNIHTCPCPANRAAKRARAAIIASFSASIIFYI
jgi:hypothetical protein